MTKEIEPTVGKSYKDASKRTLTVTEVVLDCPLGRQVRGTIRFYRKRTEHAYSTTLDSWVRTFRDKRPPAPISEMKVG